jgi:hypothetical protein
MDMDIFISAINIYELEEQMHDLDDEELLALEKLSSRVRQCRQRKVQPLRLLEDLFPKSKEQLKIEDFMKAKKQLEANQCLDVSLSICYDDPIRLDSLTYAVPSLMQQGYITAKQKEEDNMYTQTGTQTIDTERKYLSNRLNTIRNEKVSEAHKHFNMGYYPTPKNGKELKEWLANGRVKVIDNLDDDRSFAYNSPYHYLEFFDPDKKRDEKGYRKTCDTIDADATPVKDAIAIFEPTEALKAVQEFEKKTYH